MYDVTRSSADHVQNAFTWQFFVTSLRCLSDHFKDWVTSNWGMKRSLWITWCWTCYPLVRHDLARHVGTTCFFGRKNVGKKSCRFGQDEVTLKSLHLGVVFKGADDSLPTWHGEVLRKLGILGNSAGGGENVTRTQRLERWPLWGFLEVTAWITWMLRILISYSHVLGFVSTWLFTPPIPWDEHHHFSPAIWENMFCFSILSKSKFFFLNNC